MEKESYLDRLDGRFLPLHPQDLSSAVLAAIGADMMRQMLFSAILARRKLNVVRQLRTHFSRERAVALAAARRGLFLFRDGVLHK